MRNNKITKGVATVTAAALLALGGPAVTANAWESVGLKTQHPREGGTWTSGFQNFHLRSYYTVNRCHGSSVQKLMSGRVINSSRSINTAAGRRSVAEVWTVNAAALDGRYYYRVC